MLDRSLFPLFLDVQHLLCQLFRPAQHVLDHPDCYATASILVGYVVGECSGLTTKVRSHSKLKVFTIVQYIFQSVVQGVANDVRAR